MFSFFSFCKILVLSITFFVKFFFMNEFFSINFYIFVILGCAKIRRLLHSSDSQVWWIKRSSQENPNLEPDLEVDDICLFLDSNWFILVLSWFKPDYCVESWVELFFFWFFNYCNKAGFCKFIFIFNTN